MTDQSPLLSSAFSVQTPSTSRSFSLISLLRTELSANRDDCLLARCIRFLDQTDRSRAARCSHSMLDVCSSAGSWDSAGILESLRSSAARHVATNPQCFRFHGPAVRCKPGMLRHVANSNVFKHARCVELAWKVYKTPQEEEDEAEESGGDASNSDVHGSDDSDDSNEDGSDEDDDTIKNEDADATVNLDLSTFPILHLFLAELPDYLVRNLKKLPDTLKSCTIVIGELVKAENVIQFLSLLPPSLHTLQLMVSASVPLENVLKRFEQLKELIIHDCFGSDHAPLLLDTLGLSEQHLPSLRIHNELNGEQLVKSIGQQSKYFPHSPAAIVCAALTHLRLIDFRIFQECLPSVDWNQCFPNLHSLSVTRFKICPDENCVEHPKLPLAIGNRVRSLTVDDISSASHKGFKDTIIHDPFARHGLTNLVDLTVHSNLGYEFLEYLKSLQHLSMAVYPSWTFDKFAQMRSLKSIELNSWPRDCFELDRKDVLLDWKRIVKVLMGQDPEIVDNMKQGGRHQVPVESLADIFPSLTEIKLTAPSNLLYEAWYLLKTIPNLQAIKWGSKEPLLHPDQILSYYSREAIAQRENRRLHQERIDHLDKEKEDGPPKQAASSLTTSNEAFSSANSQQVSLIARNFNLFSLSLVFQSLTHVELSRASIVSKHWRSAALSPLVLRHRIRVEMHQLQGAIVHGPQLRLNAILPMFQACNSSVFRNLRIINLQGYQVQKKNKEEGGGRLIRESEFSKVYLRLWNQLPQFASLHTLALGWSHPKMRSFPSTYDLESIQKVMECPTMQHLKVFRIMAPSFLIAILLQHIPKLKSLEVVELRYSSDIFFYTPPDEAIDPNHFAKQLLQLPALKHLYVANYDGNTKDYHMDELHQLCNSASTQFEEVMWRVPMDERILQHIANKYQADKSFVFPRLRSVHISALNYGLTALLQASAAMPDLCDISIGEVDSDIVAIPSPVPAAFARQLRSLKLKFQPYDDPKGKILASVLAPLSISHFPQLECLHFFREVKPLEYEVIEEAEEEEEDYAMKIEEYMAKFVDNCPSLTELNCPSFNLGGASHWQRLVPRLHVVYSHPMVRLGTALNMQTYRATREPTREIFGLLMQLPHFQSVSFPVGRDSGLKVLTRVEIARRQARSQNSKRGLDQNEVRLQAQALLNASTPPQETVPSQSIRAEPADEDEQLLAQIVASIATP